MEMLCTRRAQLVYSTASLPNRLPAPTIRHSPRALRRKSAQAYLGADIALSPHPDAVRRRIEAEERQRKKRQEQGRKSSKEVEKWWEGPGPQNMLACNSVDEFQAQMRAAIDNEHLLVVKFFAPHCAACKAMFPKMKQIAEQHPDVVFLKVNAGSDELQRCCEELGVSKVPYFHLYKRGKLLANFSASLTTIKRVRSEVEAYKVS